MPLPPIAVIEKASYPTYRTYTANLVNMHSGKPQVPVIITAKVTDSGGLSDSKSKTAHVLAVPPDFEYSWTCGLICRIDSFGGQAIIGDFRIAGNSAEGEIKVTAENNVTGDIFQGSLNIKVFVPVRP